MSPSSSKANENVDPVNILVFSLRHAKFENKVLGDCIRSLAETLQSDLDSLNYKPDESVIAEAKEVSVILISTITGSDRLSLMPENVGQPGNEEDDEEDSGTRLGFRDTTDNDEDEDDSK